MSLPKWPRVLLEVASLDYWDRHRVEGYGYMDLPQAPGRLAPIEHMPDTYTRS